MRKVMFKLLLLIILLLPFSAYAAKAEWNVIIIKLKNMKFFHVVV